MSKYSKPVYQWQNEETGSIGFVDAWQVENGFFENNIRLKQVSILYSAAAYEALQTENAELCKQLTVDFSANSDKWRERYMRDVDGLNNEGDPIGGDTPSGFRHAIEVLQVENSAQAKEIESLKNTLVGALMEKDSCKIEEAIEAIDKFISLSATHKEPTE